MRFGLVSGLSAACLRSAAAPDERFVRDRRPAPGQLRKTGGCSSLRLQSVGGHAGCSRVTALSTSWPEAPSPATHPRVGPSHTLQFGETCCAPAGNTRPLIVDVARATVCHRAVRESDSSGHRFPVVVEVDGLPAPGTVRLLEVRSASCEEVGEVTDLEWASKPAASERVPRVEPTSWRIGMAAAFHVYAR
jgi:hypothetical protein